MSLIAEMQKRSEVTFDQANVALARQWLGPDDQSIDYTVKIKCVEPTQGDLKNLGMTIPESTKDQIKEIKVPPTVQEAVDIIRQFESGATRSDEAVADTISQHVQQDKTSLKDEKWLGSTHIRLAAVIY